MKKVNRESELIRLWLRRPEDHRTMNDVLMFYGEIHSTRPELLGEERFGDPYQQMKSTLRAHIHEPR